MSKEYLDELNRLGAIRKFDGGDNYSISDKKEFKTVKKALHRLEAIDNANPSEALECLEKIIKGFNETAPDIYGIGEIVVENVLLHYNQKEVDIIKQALLKAQEPKNYLKFEDLEKDRTYKVLLNSNQYELVKRYDDYEYRCDYITLQKKPNVSIFIYEYEKEIFNDLHLEMVEE